MFFHLKKLESPSPKDALCQDWLKLAQWFWRREFFNFVNVFSLFRYDPPLRKGQGPSFEQTWIWKRSSKFQDLPEKNVIIIEEKKTRWYMYYVSDQKKFTWIMSPLSKHGLGMQMRRLFNSVHRISDMENSEIQKMELDMRLFNLVILNYLGFCLHPKSRTRSTFLAKSGLIVCQRT